MPQPQLVIQLKMSSEIIKCDDKNLSSGIWRSDGPWNVAVTTLFIDKPVDIVS